MDIAPGQVAWLEKQQRQGPPDLAFEVQDRMREIMPESHKGAVNPRGLAAIMAVIANNFHATVQAVTPCLGRDITGSWLNGLRDQSTRYNISCRFDSPCHRLTMTLLAQRVNPDHPPACMAPELTTSSINISSGGT